MNKSEKEKKLDNETTIKKKALITGVTGQDGSYLVEFLFHALRIHLEHRPWRRGRCSTLQSKR